MARLIGKKSSPARNDLPATSPRRQHAYRLCVPAVQDCYNGLKARLAKSSRSHRSRFSRELPPLTQNERLSWRQCQSHDTLAINMRRTAARGYKGAGLAIIERRSGIGLVQQRRLFAMCPPSCSPSTPLPRGQDQSLQIHVRKDRAVFLHVLFFRYLTRQFCGRCH